MGEVLRRRNWGIERAGSTASRWALLNAIVLSGIVGWGWIILNAVSTPTEVDWAATVVLVGPAMAYLAAIALWRRLKSTWLVTFYIAIAQIVVVICLHLSIWADNDDAWMLLPITLAVCGGSANLAASARRAAGATKRLGAMDGRGFEVLATAAIPVGIESDIAIAMRTSPEDLRAWKRARQIAQLPERPFRLALQSTRLMAVMSIATGLFVLVSYGYLNRLPQFRVWFELAGVWVWILPGMGFAIAGSFMGRRARWAAVLGIITAVAQGTIALGFLVANFVLRPISIVPIVICFAWVAALAQMIVHLRRAIPIMQWVHGSGDPEGLAVVQAEK